MADEAATTEEAPETAETASTEGQANSDAAPWGDDFDPARAWKTIQEQRAEAKTLRKELSEFKKAQEQAEEAEKTELQKAIDRAEKAEGSVSEARSELWRLRAAAKHGIPEDLLDLLRGESEEDVLGVAERLAKRLTGETKTSPDSRPRPRLKSGESGGDEAPAPSPDEIAKRVRERLNY